MKVTALAAAVVLAAGAAFAGNVEPMVMDAEPMVMEPMASAGSGALTWIVPLVAIAAIALAADN